MNRLGIERHVYDTMLWAARAAAPLEACGLLAGNGERVTRCYVLDNADASAEHFSLKPEDQFAAIKDMRARGIRMLAIWHSHPATPPRMSAEDLRLALTPNAVHLILSLHTARPEWGAFRVTDGRQEPVELVIADAKGSAS